MSDIPSTVMIARRDGVLAYRKGMLRDANPHPLVSEQYAAWLDGWTSAATDAVASMEREAIQAINLHRNDTLRIDWLERMHTLHRTVEILYVVDGYNVSVCYNDTLLVEVRGDSLRSAIDNAMKV